MAAALSRSFGSCLLNVAQSGVEQDDQYVLKLREEPPPRRDRLFSRELVAPVPFKSRPDVGVSQATPGVGSEHRNDILRMSSTWRG